VTVHFKECASWSGIKFDNSLAGNTVKLRGHPKALKLPSIDGNILCGQGNDLGYGKNVGDFNPKKGLKMGNPQPSPKVSFYKRSWMQFTD